MDVRLRWRGALFECHDELVLRALGFDEVMTRGEPERRLKAKRERSGVPIPDDVWSGTDAEAYLAWVVDAETRIGLAAEHQNRL